MAALVICRKKIVLDVIVNRSSDLYTLNKNLATSQSNLPEAQDRALKQLLNAIALSNLSFDEKWDGQQVRMPTEYINSIISYLSDVLELAPNLEYLVASIQLLFSYWCDRTGDWTHREQFRYSARCACYL
ncbi:hypothetical protein [Dickeya oryzae]